MNVKEYAESNRWNNIEILPEKDNRKNENLPKSKHANKIDTTLRKKARYCQDKMQRENIRTKNDYVHWMSRKFNPDDNYNVILAPEMALCFLLQNR